MASTVLPNGIIVPEKFSRDWYADLYHNWQELDNLLGGGTPKDGTLTIQKNGNTVGTFSANQATDETVNIEVPDVNDGTLTIQQNGTTVDTFTANSSSDKTVNIQCVDLTNNQTVAGDKEFTGTTTAHDLVPSATETYNFGSSSKQWNNAYIKSLTINGVAAGDILTHNASEFVDVSTAQTVGGSKIFSDVSTGVGKNVYHFATIPYGKNTPPATASTQCIYFSGNTASQGFANSWYSGCIDQTVQPNGGTRCRWFIRNTDEKNASVELLAAVNTLTFRPSVDNIMLLGLSSHAWKDCNTKAINGINPGALSLPSISASGANAWIALDTTNWVKNAATSAAQKYTPPADGWLNVRVDNATMLGLAITNVGNYMHQMVRSETPNSLALLLPVFKNTEVAILVAGNENLTYNKATFYPCQGNV